MKKGNDGCGDEFGGYERWFRLSGIGQGSWTSENRYQMHKDDNPYHGTSKREKQHCEGIPCR